MTLSTVLRMGLRFVLQVTPEDHPLIVYPVGQCKTSHYYCNGVFNTVPSSVKYFLSVHLTEVVRIQLKHNIIIIIIIIMTSYAVTLRVSILFSYTNLSQVFFYRRIKGRNQSADSLIALLAIKHFL